MGASVLEKKMHYPVMTERQLAFRWKISLKTLRRWRPEDEGPTWHKFFQYVRYHEADVLDFERQSAQHWTAILGDGERVPKVVTRPPQEQIETEEDDGAFYITAQGVIEATGLPKHWFTTPEYRARKQVPHLALVGSIRFSLQAIWEWEQNHSTVGRPPEPKAPRPPDTEPEPAPLSRVPRWHELARELDREQFDSVQ
jgi:hypothetical protein